MRIIHGDSSVELRTLADNSVDAVVTDPPYHLTTNKKGGTGVASLNLNSPAGRARISTGFMGKEWDGGDIAFRPELWAEVLRVLKPGGHVAAFGASRAYHRMACAIEDAGFEIRDSLMWVYGTGFPKSQNVAKFIDRELGVGGTLGGPRSAAHAAMLEAGVARRGEKHEGWDRPWMDDPEAIAASQSTYIPGSLEAQRYDGFGTALKPAFEPIVLARKPLSESTVAANVLKWGTGALNIDGCRVPCTDAGGRPKIVSKSEKSLNTFGDGLNGSRADGVTNSARWPANVVHDGSDEVVGAFPDSKGQQGAVTGDEPSSTFGNVYSGPKSRRAFDPRGDSGSAARFFFNTAESDDQWLARNLPRNHAKPAGNCFNLSSELAVSVLRNAAGLTTLKSAQKNANSAARSMSVTLSELRKIGDILTETMQSFERRSSLDLLQERLSLSGNPANFVATKKPTGIITITISPSKSDGSVEHVTFNIMPLNSDHGVKDCAPSTTRFHYSAKASKADRAGSKHPTVKPIALMQWLARLITPPGGTVLDPFAGSGTTGAAAEKEGFDCILIEREAEYIADIRRRLGVDAAPAIPSLEEMLA